MVPGLFLLPIDRAASKPVRDRTDGRSPAMIQPVIIADALSIESPPLDDLLPRLKRRLRPRLRRVCLRLAYDGAAFHGFQRQPGVRTVEGALIEALEAAGLGSGLAFASRTDRGVHALGQVVAIRVPESWSLDQLRERWVANLPPELTVVALAEAPAKFHPRWSALGKRYRYTLSSDAGAQCCWQIEPVSKDRLAEAASILAGCPELRGFTAAGAPSRPAPPLSSLRLEASDDGMTTALVFEGPAFHRYAIRHMTAALVACARGEWAPSSLTALGARETPWIGPRAPADGLVLEEVYYPPNLHPFEPALD